MCEWKQDTKSLNSEILFNLFCLNKHAGLMYKAIKLSRCPELNSDTRQGFKVLLLALCIVTWRLSSRHWNNTHTVQQRRCSPAGSSHATADAKVLHLPLPGHGQRRQEEAGRHGVHGGRGRAQRHLRPQEVRLLPQQRHHLLHRQRGPAVHRGQQLAPARTQGNKKKKSPSC